MTSINQNSNWAETHMVSRILIPPYLMQPLRFWQQIALQTQIPIVLKGGAVRDLVANAIYGGHRYPRDLDLFVPNGINLVAHEAKVRGAREVDRRRRKGTQVFVFESESNFALNMEVGVLLGKPAQYSKNMNLETVKYFDALNTDLNVNSLSIELARFLDRTCFDFQEIFDPVNGIEAIRRKEVALVDLSSVYRNPENILRSILISSKLDANLSASSKKRILECAHLLRRLKPEFVLKVLRSLKTLPNPQLAFRELQSIGAIQELFPHQPSMGIEDLLALL